MIDFFRFGASCAEPQHFSDDFEQLPRSWQSASPSPSLSRSIIPSKHLGVPSHKILITHSSHSSSLSLVISLSLIGVTPLFTTQFATVHAFWFFLITLRSH